MASDTDEALLRLIPSGFRFLPTDRQLVETYLLNKILNQPLPPNRMNVVVNFYDYNPEWLTGNYKGYDRNQWYFFVPNYRNQKDRFRVAGDGYWLATADDFVTTKDNVVIACKKTFEYHQGKHPEGSKTNFIMREYKLSFNAQLNDLVLCKIEIEKSKSLKRSSSTMETSDDDDDEDDDDDDDDDEDDDEDDDDDDEDDDDIYDDDEKDEALPLPDDCHNNGVAHHIIGRQ